MSNSKTVVTNPKPLSLKELRAQLLAQPARNSGELLALVDEVAIAYSATNDERQTMREIAMRDFDSALRCFNELAVQVRRKPHQTSQFNREKNG